ncbi:MAG: DUF5684 domain-containing protein [Myxococcota bacterium]
MDSIVPLIIQLVITIGVIAGFWKVFTKAGQPGWASLIPIYNIYVMTQIAGKPAWWLVLFLIPIANIIVAILLFVAMAEKFGKSAGFGVGMAFLGFIFIPILGFGDAQYNANA